MTAEDVDDELLEAPDRGLWRELRDGAIVGVSTLVVLYVYAGASAVWPGNAFGWMLVGWGIVATVMWRVYGLPWRSR